MRKLILSSCQAKILISENNPDKISTFLKNIGSNFILKDKKIQFEGKIGWRPLLKNGPFKGWLVVRDSNDAITIQDFEGRITAWNHGGEGEGRGEHKLAVQLGEKIYA